GNKKVEDSRFLVSPVGKVVHCFRRYSYEGPFFCFYPLVANADGGSSFQNVKHLIILLMQMSSGTIRIWFKPPFRNTVLLCRFVLIRFKYSSHCSAVVRSSLSGF